MSDPNDAPQQKPLGDGQDQIRILNFSGGGFDSVMQLGVTHALLVIQGKAPDAVVGLSTGAIGAAALAEALQAGDVPAPGIEKSDYEEILGARVVRFREFVDACQTAPERILDAIIPDAYQIDSFDPLASLQIPRLSKDERAERDAWIERKSGLVRIYNDLLSIGLPLGTITRMIRRGLGFSAANSLTSFGSRLVVKFIEIAKLWLVLGSQLSRFTSLLVVFGSAISGTKHKVGPTSAGSIIFRFKPVKVLVDLWRKFLSFSVLLIAWVTLSYSFLFLPFLLAHVFTAPPMLTPGVSPPTPAEKLLAYHLILYAVPFLFRFATIFKVLWLLGVWGFLTFPIVSYDLLTREVAETRFSFFYIFYFLYLIPLIFPLTPAALAFDRTKLGAAFRDFNKGLLAFFYYLAQWTLVLVPFLIGLLSLVGLVFIFIFALIFLAIFFFAYEPGWLLSQPDGGRFFIAATFVLAVFILVVARPVFQFLRTLISYRRQARKHVSVSTWITRNFLNAYGIGPALAHPYRLKQFLIELFDQGYYGDLNMPTVLNQGLRDRDTGTVNSRKPRVRRKLEDYERYADGGRRGIILGVAAADVAGGRMTMVPRHTAIVDCLLAATAKPPIFEPVEIPNESGDRPVLLVDGLEVGNAPINAVVQLIRQEGLAENTEVHLYPVDSLPISRGKELGPYAPVQGRPFLNLVDIVLRALQLQRFRDANVEREVTKVVNRVLPKNSSTVQVDIDGKPRTFFRGRFAPIELAQAPYLNRIMFFGSKTERQDAIARTIADGCRASLGVMLHKTLQDIQSEPALDSTEVREARRAGYISCNSVTRQALVRKARECGMQDITALPGSRGGDDGPGLAEICRHCHLKRREIDRDPGQSASGGDEVVASRCIPLVRHSEVDAKIIDWPHELEELTASGNVIRAAQFDKDRSVETGDPQIACLFSGGVFRGVFQMGVLNALAMARVRPKLVAGASVGSITAAMVASALSEPDSHARTNKILQLSSIYLGIDRFILTDRFADFIRNWTIRASEAKFSLRQLDEVFRKFDDSGANKYQLTVREVLAGLERLFYINPYQVNDLVRAARNRQGRQAGLILKDALQQWLDRLDVGQEVLGAHPIKLLIENFVIPTRWQSRPDDMPFGGISDDIVFMATSTNLTQGALEILSSSDAAKSVTLIEGLLASSAFPGVFSPRRSWDLIPGTSDDYQYIDGGVMDNLPLHSVLAQMRELADQQVIPLRPSGAPHLMLAASLEVEKRESVDEQALRDYWPELLSRTTEMKYNAKLRTFVRVADNVQDIRDQFPAERDALKVRVAGIMPRWLCNTFAFHPMLGFRRTLQAASIAHGCAATLLALGGLRDYANAWRLDRQAIPKIDSFDTANERLEKPDRKARKNGRCWLSDIQCPYSKEALTQADIPTESEETRYWLSEIHRKCWDRQSHERRRQ